ncbi:hypothetical protein ACHAWC_011046 [Mediolabrus comicus]
MAEAHNLIDDSLEEFISEFAAFYSLPTSAEEEKFEAQAISPPPGIESTTAPIGNSEEADLVKEFLSEFAAVYSLDSTKIEVTTTVTSARSSSSMKKKKRTPSNIIKQQPETPMEELISDFIATYTIETTLPDGDIERVLANYNYISGSIAFSREEKEESRSYVPKRMKRMFSRKKMFLKSFQQVSSMIKKGATSDDDTSCSSSSLERGTTSCPAH